jgi:hypothetical protein
MSATSSSGFSLGGPGYFEVGGGTSSTTGTLNVPSGVSDHVQGNMEITSGSLLTGGGTVFNSGLLQLDAGSSTKGLGAYVQGNSGTLAIEIGAMTLFTPWSVTGTAQLSDTLELLDYDPQVGDEFTVVVAGAVEDAFDSIPSGMEQSEGPNTAPVTQVEPPA